MLSFPADLNFSRESEDHQLSLPDPHEFKVNVPTIRPGGLVGFQIMTTASNNITFTQLADNAQIVTSRGAEAQKQKYTLLEIGIVAAVVFFWLPVIAILVRVFWQAGKSWQAIETYTSQPDIRIRLIVLIIILYIYKNVILGSVGIFQAWLPLPRISFDELIRTFLLYLLVTRYRLIEDWISAGITKKRGKQMNNGQPLIYNLRNSLVQSGSAR